MSQTPSSRGLPDAGRDPAVIRAFLVMLRTARPDASTSAEGLDRVLTGAREFSQRLGLPGLATLLDALRRRLSLDPERGVVGEGWSAVRDALAACEAKGALAPLLEREAAHEALALRVGAAAELSPAAPPRVARTPSKAQPVRLEETLEGLRVEWPRNSTIVARQLELGEKSAAALRAAIEWLLGESPAQWPLEVKVDDTALEISLPRIEASGVEAAGKTLAACGASLVPPGPGGTAWRVRIPWRTEAPSFLLVGMGELPVALPWASVLRMSMLTPAARDALARRTGWAVLDSLTGASTSTGGESPVVLLGLGLRRGLITASRLVWRMPCTPEPNAGVPPASWLKRGLLTEDGDRFWEADVEALLNSPQAERAADWWRPMLRQLASRPMPPPAPRVERKPEVPPAPPAAMPPEPLPAPESVAPQSIAPPAEPASPIEPPAMEPPPIESPATEPPAIEPLATEQPPPAPPTVAAQEAAPVPPAPAPPIPRPAPAVPAVRVVPPARLEAPPALPVTVPRAVLIAEDSLTASMFLSRLLESEGARCQTVESLAGLRAALAERHWDLVCVDVDLPDAPAGEALEAARAHGATVVALVRDSFDEGLAARAEVTAFLRKPFDPRSVHDLLHGLPRPGGTP